MPQQIDDQFKKLIEKRKKKNFCNPTLTPNQKFPAEDPKEEAEVSSAIQRGKNEKKGWGGGEGEYTRDRDPNASFGAIPRVNRISHRITSNSSWSTPNSSEPDQTAVVEPAFGHKRSEIPALRYLPCVGPNLQLNRFENLLGGRFFDACFRGTLFYGFSSNFDYFLFGQLKKRSSQLFNLVEEYTSGKNFQLTFSCSCIEKVHPKPTC